MASIPKSEKSEEQEEQTTDDLAMLASEIIQLKNHIEAEKAVYVKEKVMMNQKKVEYDADHISALANSRGENSSTNMLDFRMKNPLRLILDYVPQSSYDVKEEREEEDDFPVTATLPFVEKIPRFTTWTFSTRNKKMTEDQTSEEVVAPSEEKHEFSEGEKRIIRMVSQCYEPTNEVVETLTKFIGGTTTEIHEAFKMLKIKEEESTKPKVFDLPEVENDMMSMHLDKSLKSCLDTFDSLFCRQCLVFDCDLHGYNQPIITPAERLIKGPVEPEEDEDEGPCGDDCYKLVAKKCPEIDGSTNVDSTTLNKRPYKDPFDSDVIKKEYTVWSPLEKDIYLKGLEIFGRNSCHIKSLLSGNKSCIEVYNYMNDGGPTVSSTEEEEVMVRMESVRRKGKGKKQSSGQTLTWRGIAGGIQSNKQYSPCECKSTCGKDCSCLKNSTTCEKYCGCLKSCKNRFRGCHCAKSQCQSQQCPCFVASRECDPDVCRNCWVSCGGGELGEPERKGEGQCDNMRVLLRQQQRILLGISDVAGWGAFAKNTIEKDEYIGEYTGELISHEEAESRGKIYDHENKSFLFNLNEEYVIDALRQGNKLKFVNHSVNPNCYAKIMKVAGDHCVTLFAKERIEAGQEIFYDYCYRPHQQPFWARNLDDPKEGPSGSVPPPQARIKKPQPNNPK